MRSYRQFCPAARALDIVGERWTLLVVRDLLHGPKRYTDLQAGLPGVGPNVLAARLRSLEQAGLVEKKRLPPPAASTVYSLTELGEGLRPVVASLFEWGLQLLDAPSKHDAVKASYWLPALEAAAQPDALGPDVDDQYEFRVGGEVVAAAVRGGELRTWDGPAERPDVVVTTDHETFAGLGRATVLPADAIAAGRLRVEGDPQAAARCAALFGVREAAASGSGGAAA